MKKNFTFEQESYVADGGEGGQMLTVKGGVGDLVIGQFPGEEGKGGPTTLNVLL